MNTAALQTALADCPLITRFYFYETIDSTMSQARRLATGDSTGHHHGTLVIANHQDSGRGRHGRQWTAPAATSILATLVLHRSQLPGPADARQLSLLAAAIPVAICRAIMQFIPAARIKYPNDIVIDGRKLGGILLEKCDSAILAGFGINCHQELADLPPDSRMPATSVLLETGRRVPRDNLLTAIINEMTATLHPAAFSHSGNDMASLCETLGRTICIDRGKDILTGVAQTIGPDGTLVLDTDDGPRRVYTTEVVRTWSPENGQ